jgi:2',3'-cyclic-nucleotide 2'-phosphodiesterase
MPEKIDILFLGDIVGRPGRKIVSQYLENIKNDNLSYGTSNPIKSSTQPDFIIANVENASHGFGLTEKNHKELSDLGIDAFTSGNHIWDRKEIFEFIETSDKLIRPLNYPEVVPGVGKRVFELPGGTKIAVINLLGSIFMNPIDSPWKTLESVISKIKQITPIIILDFHAEATAEKVSMGYFGNNLGLSAVIGTHTHIQTADEKILNNGTAYITDAGFCGSNDGVIGMDIQSSLKRFLTGLPERFDVAPFGNSELNGVRFIIDKNSAKAEYIERIKFNTCSSEDN